MVVMVVHPWISWKIIALQAASHAVKAKPSWSLLIRARALFTGKIDGFRWRFSLKPIHWNEELEIFKLTLEKLEMIEQNHDLNVIYGNFWWFQIIWLNWTGIHPQR